MEPCSRQQVYGKGQSKTLRAEQVFTRQLDFLELVCVGCHREMEGKYKTSSE